MAVNQVSLFFYPPRWRQRLVVEDPKILTARGTPVTIAHVAPVVESTATPLSLMAVIAWLVEQGFTPVDWAPDCVFERGQVDSTFGFEKEIEVCIGDEAGEVYDLYIRFTLSQDSPPPLEEWASFVVPLCQRFELCLGGNGLTPCGEAEFLPAVRQDSFYREFAATFNWPS